MTWRIPTPPLPLVDLRFDVTTIGDEVDIVVTHLPTRQVTRGHVKGGPVQPLRDRLVAELKVKVGENAMAWTTPPQGPEAFGTKAQEHDHKCDECGAPATRYVFDTVSGPGPGGYERRTPDDKPRFGCDEHPVSSRNTRL